MASARVLGVTVSLALLAGCWLSSSVSDRPWRPDGFHNRIAHAGIARLELTSPAGGWELRGPFAWQTDAPVDRYYLELLDERYRSFYRAEVREPEMDIPPIFFQLLASGERYAWRVYGVDRTGRRIAASDVRTFIWRG